MRKQKDVISIENNLIERLEKRRLPGNLRFCFASAFALFLLVHFYWFKSKYMFADDSLLSPGGWAYLGFGRWALSTVREISGRYSIPWFTGMLSALYMALAASFVTATLRIENKPAVFLAVLAMAAFTAVSKEVLYIHHIDAKMLALLLVCAGCYATLKARFGFIPGGLLFCLSLGIYQAYYSFSVFLLLFAVLLSCARDEKGWFRRGLRSIAALLIGVIGYKVVLDICLKAARKKLQAYGGASAMWDITPALLLQRAKNACSGLFSFYFSNESRLMVIAAAVLFAMCAVMGIALLLKNGVHRDWKRLLCTIAMILLLPLASGSIWVMADTVPLRAQFALVAPLLICAVLLDRMGVKEEATSQGETSEEATSQEETSQGETSQEETSREETKEGKRKLRCRISLSVQALALAACLLLSCCNAMQANEDYLNSDVTNKTAFSWYTRLASRIEEQAGQRTKYSVCFIGTPRKPAVPEGFNMSTLIEETRILRYCSWYCGTNLVKASKESAAEIKETYGELIEKMPRYPREGSVQVIQGVVVVKFGNG